MSFSIGLDVGGTKIAGAAFDDGGREVKRVVLPTPADYQGILSVCRDIVAQLDKAIGPGATIGAGVPGAVDAKTGSVIFSGNTPCVIGKPFEGDLEKQIGRPVRIANDADCAALSEAKDGAGAGCNPVFGVIMGTGVGGGLVVDGRIVRGVNGLTGEFGHITLPYRETSDGPAIDCNCAQKGCIDKTVSGLGLARLHEFMCGKKVEGVQVAELARKGDAEALRTLDQFYTTVAKAMMPVIHMFDPEIIIVSGGLTDLPGLIEEVPKRWGRYTLRKNLATRFAAAKHGAMSGLRGAAWVGKQGR